MVWIIIISFLVVTIGMFFWKRSKMERSILREGGIRKKFETLINLILSQDSEARVVNETPLDISIVLSTMSGKIIINILVTFNMIAKFDSVTITYFLDSYVLGKHQLPSWEFDIDEDQEYIHAKMNKDISAYMENINFDKKLEEGVEKVMKKYFKGN